MCVYVCAHISIYRYVDINFWKAKKDVYHVLIAVIYRFGGGSLLGSGTWDTSICKFYLVWEWKSYKWFLILKSIFPNSSKNCFKNLDPFILKDKTYPTYVSTGIKVLYVVCQVFLLAFLGDFFSC